jgi:hypothetical protein
MLLILFSSEWTSIRLATDNLAVMAAGASKALTHAEEIFIMTEVELFSASYIEKVKVKKEN